MGSIARVLLRRNNNLTPRLFRRQPPSTTVGTPLRLSTYYFRDNSPHDSHSFSLPIFFHDRYGHTPFTSAPVATMMMKKAKPPSSDDSSDDESEADNDYKRPPPPPPPQRSSVKQDDEALYFKVDMPGVSKEDAKVYLEGNTLMVKGVRKSDPHFKDGSKDKDNDNDNDDGETSYVAGVSLTSMQIYKLDGIKAEMKNGVLKVKVPKLKDEERDDVLHVKID